MDAASDSETAAARSPRVLLADDHPAMLALAASALVGECEVVGAVADGTALLTAAAGLDPDVIVLDIAMPQLDGLAAARQLRVSHPRTQLVFLTVHEDADFARAAFAAGALGFVIKPRLASDLLAAVRAALAGTRWQERAGRNALAGTRWQERASFRPPSISKTPPETFAMKNNHKLSLFAGAGAARIE